MVHELRLHVDNQRITHIIFFEELVSLRFIVNIEAYNILVETNAAVCAIGNPPPFPKAMPPGPTDSPRPHGSDGPHGAGAPPPAAIHRDAAGQHRDNSQLTYGRMGSNSRVQNN